MSIEVGVMLHFISYFFSFSLVSDWTIVAAIPSATKDRYPSSLLANGGVSIDAEQLEDAVDHSAEIYLHG